MQIENHGFNLTELEKSIISFFSEGNSYYSTFKPLVDSFLKKQIKINYYTLDSNDKILKIKSKYLKSKYLGFKYLAYLRFALIECDYLISTTPNIGNLNYICNDLALHNHMSNLDLRCQLRIHMLDLP